MEIDTIYPIDNKLFLVTSKNEVIMNKSEQRTTIYHGTIYDTIKKKYSSGFYINNRLYKKDGIYTVANKDKFKSYIRQQQQEYKNVIYHKDFILEKIHVYKFNDTLNYFYPIYRVSMNVYIGYQIKFNTYGSVFFRKIKFRIKNKDGSSAIIRYVIDYLDKNKNVKMNYEHLFLNYEKDNSNIFQELYAQCQNFYNFFPSCIPIFSKKLNESDRLQSLEINKTYNIQNRFSFCPLMVNSFIHYYYGLFYTRNQLQGIYGFFFITKDGAYDFLNPFPIENQFIQHIDNNKPINQYMNELELRKMYAYIKYRGNLDYFYPIKKTSVNEYLGYSIKSNKSEQTISFPKVKLVIKPTESNYRFETYNLDKYESVNNDKYFFMNYENTNPDIFEKLQTISRDYFSNFESFLSSCTPIFSKIFDNHDKFKSLTINTLHSIKGSFFFKPLKQTSKYYFGLFYVYKQKHTKKGYGFLSITENGEYDDVKESLYARDRSEVENNKIQQNLSYIIQNIQNLIEEGP